MPAEPRPGVSILVSTCQRPRHLALALESIALQRGTPRCFEVVVSSDGVDDATAAVVERFAATAGFPVRLVTAAHDGFRLARTRNNAARAARGDYLLFLDGDCVLPGRHLAAHLERRRRGAALLGHCARLTEATSGLLVPENLAVTNLGGLVTTAERRALAKRHRRARWHNLVRHPTKPRLTGGDFGVWRSDFERVNGFDERFVGWGQEDDDFGLRLRSAGVRLESVLDLTASLHVWHPADPSATTRWRDGANVSYFNRRGRLAACRRGLAQRRIEDVRWGVPADAEATPLGRLLVRRLAAAPRSPPGAACEVELVVHPGRRFTRPAECRLLLLPPGAPVPRFLATRADRVGIVAGEDDLEAILEDVG